MRQTKQLSLKNLKIGYKDLAADFYSQFRMLPNFYLISGNFNQIKFLMVDFTIPAIANWGIDP